MLKPTLPPTSRTTPTSRRLGFESQGPASGLAPSLRTPVNPSSHLHSLYHPVSPPVSLPSHRFPNYQSTRLLRGKTTNFEAASHGNPRRHLSSPCRGEPRRGVAISPCSLSSRVEAPAETKPSPNLSLGVAASAWRPPRNDITCHCDERGSSPLLARGAISPRVKRGWQ